MTPRVMCRHLRCPPWISGVIGSGTLGRLCAESCFDIYVIYCFWISQIPSGAIGLIDGNNNNNIDTVESFFYFQLIFWQQN
jgi:hypothetical protein